MRLLIKTFGAKILRRKYIGLFDREKIDLLTDIVGNEPSSKVNTDLNILRKPCALSTGEV